MIELATAILREEEGFRSKVYRCSEGYPTIGYGQVIGPKDGPLGNVTIPQEVANLWLETTVKQLHESLRIEMWYAKQVGSRQAILLSMAYQLGLTGLKKFKRMIGALEAKRYDDVKAEALDSLWAKQTPARATRHANQLQTGVIDDRYVASLSMNVKTRKTK